MPWWLLTLVGLSIIDVTITINGLELKLSTLLRIIVFICCCIWG